MNVAVIGGSGFIGLHVVQALFDAGHKVKVVDLEPCLTKVPVGVSFSDVSILDLPMLKTALKGCEVVYHLAARADVDEILQNPVPAVEVNVVGTANVLEAARQNQARRVILTSSDWVNAGSEHVYTTTKLAAEMLCANYWQLYGLPYTILRCSTPYGPGMRQTMAIPSCIRQALKGGPIYIDGDGRQTRQFVYVTDVARAHVLAMSDRAKNKTYNVAGFPPVSIFSVATAVWQALGVGGQAAEVDYDVVMERTGDYRGGFASTVDIERDLGWEQKISLEEGIRLCVAAMTDS